MPDCSDPLSGKLYTEVCDPSPLDWTTYVYAYYHSDTNSYTWYDWPDILVGDYWQPEPITLYTSPIGFVVSPGVTLYTVRVRIDCLTPR